MNKFALTLGILLLAGLSFATALPTNWMMYSTKSYGCNFYDIQGFPPASPYEYSRWDIALNYFNETGCFNYDAMASYTEGTAEALWGRPGHWGMCQNSGCPTGIKNYPSAFRGNIVEYNAASLGFTNLFLAGVKECLTNPAYSGRYSRSEVLSMLAGQREAYRMCLDMAPVCYGCGY